MLKLPLSVLIAVANLALTAGCAVYDPRLTAWDPPPGSLLMDQIPNEDGAANRRCCGHLRQCEAWQTPRC